MTGWARIPLRATFACTSQRAANPADLVAMRNHVADVLARADDVWDAMRQMERRLKHNPRLRRLPISVTFSELPFRDDVIRSVDATVQPEE